MNYKHVNNLAKKYVAQREYHSLSMSDIFSSVISIICTKNRSSGEYCHLFVCSLWSRLAILSYAEKIVQVNLVQ